MHFSKSLTRISLRVESEVHIKCVSRCIRYPACVHSSVGKAVVAVIVVANVKVNAASICTASSTLLVNVHAPPRVIIVGIFRRKDKRSDAGCRRI